MAVVCPWKMKYRHAADDKGYYCGSGIAKYFDLTTSHPHSIGYAGLCSYCLPRYALGFFFFFFNLVAIQYVVRTNSPRVAKHVTTL